MTGVVKNYDNEMDKIEKIDKSLEEAADKHIRKVVDAAGHPGWDWATQDIADAFIAGAKWKADHLRDSTKMVDKSLEEAADEWYEKCPAPKSTWWDEGEEMKLTDSKETFIAGAKWQKEQMLKDAVEGNIHLVGFHNAIFIKEPEWVERLDRLNGGDKVRIVIVKED